MGLFGLGRKKEEEEGFDPLGGAFEELSAKEKEARAGAGAALVGNDPGAYTDVLEWSHFAMSLWLDSKYPCDRRKFFVEKDGKPVRACKLMDVICEVGVDGSNEHGFRKCLNCPVIGSKASNMDNLLQVRMLLADPSLMGEGGGGEKIELTPEEYAMFQKFLASQ